MSKLTPTAHSAGSKANGLTFQATSRGTEYRTKYQYDTSGRLRIATYGNNDLVWRSYDLEGRLVSMGITNGQASPVASFAYQWDAGGSLIAITNNDTNVAVYAYDAAGQLTNEISGTTTNSWAYDDAGNWLSSAGEGKWRIYNDDNEFVGTSTNSNTITIIGTVEPGPRSNKWYHTTVACRGMSNLVNQADGTFILPNVPVYPGTNQLVVTVTDVSGNQSQQTRTIVKNPQETFAYDGNGNLTNWTSGSTTWGYTWDWDNRLSEVYSNGITKFRNDYDAQNRRIGKWESGGNLLYIHDRGEIVGVVNSSGALIESFTRGVGLAGDIGTLVAVTHHGSSPMKPGTYYTHHNHRGDVIMTRTNAGTSGTYEYTAFGKLKAQTGTNVCRFKFSSKEMDASTGLSYYGYRFYAPQWQRWINRDPISERGGLNLYAYAVNTPDNIIDPFGRWTISIGVTGSYGMFVGGAISGGWINIGHDPSKPWYDIKSWSWGWLQTGELGSGGPPNLFGGFYGQFTTAKCVHDLKGLSIQVGGGGGEILGGGVGGDIIFGSNYYGINVQAGATGGSPVEIHALVGATWGWDTDGGWR